MTVPTLFAVAILGALLVLNHRLILKSTPKITGTIKVLSGIIEDVEIQRDQAGIPHIKAQSKTDLYFAWGFVQAQDRLWQMDLLRRMALGRLSEIWGVDYLETDKLLLQWDFLTLSETYFDSLSPDYQTLLLAYSNGINAFIERFQHQLPIEFSLLNYQPKKWLPAHSLAIWLLWQWSASAMRNQLFQEMLRHSFAEPYRELFNSTAPPVKSSLVTGLLKKVGFNFFEQCRKINQMSGFPIPINDSTAMDFNFSFSDSATAWLSFAPWSPLTIPTIWYLQELECPDFLIFGATFPGLPLLLSGTNGHIAWGMVPLQVNDAQISIEEIPLKSLPTEKEVPLAVVQARQVFVPILNRDTLTVTIHQINQKTILEMAPDTTSGQLILLVVDWTGQNRLDTFIGLLQIGQSVSLNTFQYTLNHQSTANSRFYYADVTGKIADFMTGCRFPVAFDGRFKRTRKKNLSVEAESFWIELTTGLAHLKPHIAASRARDSLVARHLPAFFKYDSARIKAPNLNSDQLSMSDLYQFQKKGFSSIAAQIMPSLASEIDSLKEQAGYENYHYYLKTWDYCENPESVGATFFNIFIQDLVENIFRDELGDSLFYCFCELPHLLSRATIQVLSDTGSIWLDDISTPTVRELLSDLFQKSALNIHKFVQMRYHNILPQWRWKNVSQQSITHLLADGSHRDRVFNSKPVFFRDGGFPVNLLMQGPFFEPLMWGRPLHLVFEMSRTVKIQWLLSTGQAGQPLAPHYHDQLDSWLNWDFRSRVFPADHSKSKNKRLVLRR